MAKDNSQNDQNRKKNIVVIPFDAVGHVNGCRGATYTSLVLSNKFRVYILLERAFEGRLKPLGYEEVIYDVPKPDPDATKAGENFAQNLLKSNIIGKISIEEKLQKVVEMFSGSDFVFSVCKPMNECLKQLAQKIPIDLFITDDAHPLPFSYFSGIPIVRCLTGAPFSHAMEPELPPPYTGLPSDCDPEMKKHCMEMVKQIFCPERLAKFLNKLGYPPYEDDWFEKRFRFYVYAYPKELNHWKIETKPNWFNLEVFDKNPEAEKIDLEQLVGPRLFNDDLDGRFSGKWIYLSLGSMGSVDLDLMQRLIGTLAKTNHKYIVSKGPRHQEYDLARNMWGSGYLPQIKILPVVDLVITHGGTNTLSETFAQGKPMIVMPLFCDQYDNAQRMVETNFGARFDPYDYDEKELIDSIDNLLNDQQLKQRLEKASQRIQKSNAHQIFAKMVEEILDGITVDQGRCIKLH